MVSIGSFCKCYERCCCNCYWICSVLGVESLHTHIALGSCAEFWVHRATETAPVLFTSSGHTVSLSQGNRVSLCSKTRENAKMKMVWMSRDLQLSSLDTTMGIQAPNRLQHLEAAPWCGIETLQCHKELSSCVSVPLRWCDPQNLPAYSCVPYCSEMSPWEVSVFSSKVDQGFSTYLFSPVLWSQALLVF